MKKNRLALIVIALVFICFITSCEEKIKSYTVNFVTDHGESIPAETVLHGSTVTEPEVKSIDGVKFCGWYLNDVLFDFSNPITSNITLVAKWAHDQHLFGEDNICSICSGIKCGENAAYIYEENTETLRITGTGSIDDYYDGKSTTFPKPWDDLFSESKIKNVIIEEGITRIGHYAFVDLAKAEKGETNSIISVELPNTLEEIGLMAFAYCSFSEIIVKENISKILDGAFTSCSNLKNVTILNTFEPGKTDRIFEDSINIEKILFGGTKEEWIDIAQWSDGDTDVVCSDGNIEYYLSKDRKLFGCLTPYGRGLSEITIPEGVEIVGVGAFKDSKITSIKMPSTLFEIRDSAFMNCQELVTVELNKGLNTIKGSAFSGCTKLKNIELNEELKTIESQVFEGCISLEKIIIPKGIQYLYPHVFKSCTNTLGVEFKGTTESLKGAMNVTSPCGAETKKMQIKCTDGDYEYCIGNHDLNP